MRSSVPRSEVALGIGAVGLAVALLGTSAVVARGDWSRWSAAVAAAAPMAAATAPTAAAPAARAAAEPATAGTRSPDPPAVHRITAGAAIEPATQQGSAEDSRLESLLSDRLSHATSRRYGMAVTIDGVGDVATLGGYLSMMPASTQKLFTTLPLLLANPDRQLVTSVAAAVALKAGVVHGNLVLRASADPSLARPDITSLAKQVRAHGIRRVTGRLVLDIGNLSLRTREDGWKSDMVPDDVGPLSPLPIRSDQLRHDSWYLSHPTLGNLHIVRTLFAKQGVRILGPNQIVRTSHAARVVATHSSPTMARLVRHTLRWSDNFWAESLLNVEGGRKAVNQVVAAAGVTGSTYETDGSGLSYLDRETVVGETALLRYAYASPARNPFVAALPVACRTGTLEHEFCGTVAAGNVWAKTGTLAHAKALAGYTIDARGRLVTFAILCNAVRDLDAASRAMQRAVLVLRNYDG